MSRNVRKVYKTALKHYIVVDGEKVDIDLSPYGYTTNAVYGIGEQVVKDKLGLYVLHKWKKYYLTGLK